MTEWRPVREYEGWYEVSDDGRVRNVRRRSHTRPDRELKPQRHPAGYHQVRLNVEGVGKTHTIHTLVARAFLGERPEGYEVCHFDGNKTNNRVENLRWDTRSENALDRVRAGEYRNQNSERTHCWAGHAYDDANTYWHNGNRICRQCKRDRRQRARNEGRRVT